MCNKNHVENRGFSQRSGRVLSCIKLPFVMLPSHPISPIQQLLAMWHWRAGQLHPWCTDTGGSHQFSFGDSWANRFNRWAWENLKTTNDLVFKLHFSRVPSSQSSNSMMILPQVSNLLGMSLAVRSPFTSSVPKKWKLVHHIRSIQIPSSLMIGDMLSNTFGIANPRNLPKWNLVSNWSVGPEAANGKRAKKRGWWSQRGKSPMDDCPTIFHP